MEQIIPKELIEKYLQGKCSPEEEQKLQSWYNSFEDEPDPMAQLSEEAQNLLKERMLIAIKERVVNGSDFESVIIKKLMAYAASIAAILLLVLTMVKYAGMPVKLPAKQASQSLLRIVSNHSVKIKKHVLPDGTTIWLQPASSISYNKQFRGRLREISMKGDAFFDVTRNPERPFVVHTEDIEVKVLGTSFNVKSREGSASSEVSVLTGKVAVARFDEVSQRRESVVLVPAEKAVYTAEAKVIKKEKLEDRSLDMWKKSSLTFDNVPVSRVLNTISERFNISLEVVDPTIRSYSLRADFTDVNLPSILDILGKSLGLTYEVKGDKILLSRNEK
ncbi:FecR family protein [Pedobacter sp. SYSU D00535]|uniref:FecR family protein n=1 Tax=Pedobacter sp. SYSU D00535 TaxID=2810308 RepID=UPI001A96E15F|nr:FecR domain-containing protein [Pedobacter sp. SYSU D00535]